MHVRRQTVQNLHFLQQNQRFPPLPSLVKQKGEGNGTERNEPNFNRKQGNTQHGATTAQWTCTYRYMAVYTTNRTKVLTTAATATPTTSANTDDTMDNTINSNNSTSKQASAGLSEPLGPRQLSNQRVLSVVYYYCCAVILLRYHKYCDTYCDAVIPLWCYSDTTETVMPTAVHLLSHDCRDPIVPSRRRLSQSSTRRS